MEQTSSKSTKTIFTDSGDRNIVTQLELPLIIFLLKKLSGKDHPLSVSEIRKYMNDLTSLNHSDKTIRRKLQDLCTAQNDPDAYLIANSLFLTFGGDIVEVTNDSPNIKKTQSKYYFRPLLDTGDVAMICGAITSNRYLTSKEKEYLH